QDVERDPARDVLAVAHLRPLAEAGEVRRQPPRIPDAAGAGISEHEVAGLAGVQLEVFPDRLAEPRRLLRDEDLPDAAPGLRAPSPALALPAATARVRAPRLDPPDPGLDVQVRMEPRVRSEEHTSELQSRENLV